MELKKSNKIGSYQYKRVAFEIADATTFSDIAYVFKRYPELKEKFCYDTDNSRPTNESKGKTKRSKSKRT